MNAGPAPKSGTATTLPYGPRRGPSLPVNCSRACQSGRGSRRLPGTPSSIQRTYGRLSGKFDVVRLVALMGLMFVPSVVPQTPSAEPTRFDVISIRLVTSVRNSSPTNIDRGRLTAENISIRRLIQAAFDVRDYQILNTPGWIDGAR